jgi:hypothetical protein
VQFPTLTKLASRSLNEGFRIAVVAGAIVFVLMPGSPTAADRLDEARYTVSGEVALAPISSHRFTLAQDDDDSDENDIAPSDVEKYVATYRDMQRDRSLTVEQAAAKEGLSLSAFRDLEQKVERDDAAREHVRDELQESAAQASRESSAPQSMSSK